MPPINTFLLTFPVLAYTALSGMYAPAAMGQEDTGDRLDWPVEFVLPDLADRRRPDGRSRGGASRGGCDLPEGEEPLTALVPSVWLPNEVLPETNLDEDSPTAADVNEGTYEAVLSLTTDTHPDFWFYIPYPLDGDLDLELVLQDEAGNFLYQTRFTPEFNNSGILKVSLPNTAPALALETPYRWFLVAYCEPHAPAFVEGWIQRVELNSSIQEQLQQASPAQKATIYANQGIWQDALVTLGDLYHQNPDSVDVQAEWVALLNSASLEEIATKKLLPTFELNFRIEDSSQERSDR